MKSSIAIITTVSNYDLYEKTVATFPDLPKIYNVDGRSGFFGLDSILYSFKKLKTKKEIRWLVFCDEDILFQSESSFYALLEHLEKNEVDVCGIRDGGLLSWRDKNPYLINPFFSIFNFQKIIKTFNEEEIRQQKSIEEQEFCDDLSELKYSFDENSTFEEYYCFFLWLRRKSFKFYFLNAAAGAFKNDVETTAVYNQENELVLYHTWYARAYGRNDYHTGRIDNVIKSGKIIKPPSDRKIITFKNKKFILSKKYNRLKRKILNKLKRL